MNDQIETLKARMGELQRQVDELWPSRITNPEAFSAALNELNEVGAELNRLWEAEQR